MEWLESRAVRPRQARYQAALRPDMNCFIHSKALFNFTATPIRRVCLDCAKIVPIVSLDHPPARIQRHFRQHTLSATYSSNGISHARNRVWLSDDILNFLPYPSWKGRVSTNQIFDRCLCE